MSQIEFEERITRMVEEEVILRIREALDASSWGCADIEKAYASIRKRGTRKFVGATIARLYAQAVRHGDVVPKIGVIPVDGTSLSRSKRAKMQPVIGDWVMLTDGVHFLELVSKQPKASR